MLLAILSLFFLVAFFVMTGLMVLLYVKRSGAKNEARTLLSNTAWDAATKTRADAVIKKLDLWAPDREAKDLIRRLTRRVVG